jgi:hypothetical protein
MSPLLTATIFLTFAWSQPEPPSEQTLPVQGAVQAAVSFDATVDVQGGGGGGAEPVSSETSFTGAVWRERWYFTVGGAATRPQRFCCDGERIWLFGQSVVMIDPAERQFAIPISAWWIPQMLQVGDRLWGPFDPLHGRMGHTRFGVAPQLSDSESGERVARFAWSLGSTESEYRYRYRRVEERWLWNQTEFTQRRRMKDGTVVVEARSVESMDDPVRVGDALYARRLHAQGWVGDPRKPSAPLEPATKTIGTLHRVEPIQASAFDAEFAGLMTLSPGVRVLDRTRPAVLTFVVGQPEADFDGVGYDFTGALASRPSDSELMDLLRGAKRVVARDQQSVPVDGVQPLGDVGVEVQASGAVTSGGIALEPGRRLDLGMVRFGESPTKTTAKFQLRNTGDKTRTIKAVKASCGCTETAIDQKILAPGATATITTTLTVERAKTYHSSIWVAFEEDAGGAGGPGQVEELQIVAVGVPEKAIRATALKRDAAGDVLTIVLYSTDGKPEGDVGVPKGAESTIASDSGWLPVGGDAKTAKHWIRDIVKKP